LNQKNVLPLIDLSLSNYCRIAFNYCLGLFLPIGRTLWFDWQAVLKTGKELHLNLDEYLTALLATLFFGKGTSSPLLTFYAAIPGRFALSLCSSDLAIVLHIREAGPSLSGYLEMRHDFIPQTSAPFLLYKEGMFYRLHPLSQPKRAAFYVWDLGDCLGNFLKEVDKAFYFRVLNDKKTYCEYAVVPKNPFTSIQHQGSVIPVHHALCTVM
jgi:hypothetical protein